MIITTTISGISYKTLYAHLKQVGYSGAATANVTLVGLAGDSGSAAGAAHLHFGIKQANSSRCNTNGSNAACPTSCSNCEAKASPQACKPGRMQTLAGLSTMSDGVCLAGLERPVAWRGVSLMGWQRILVLPDSPSLYKVSWVYSTQDVEPKRNPCPGTSAPRQ